MHNFTASAAVLISLAVAMPTAAETPAERAVKAGAPTAPAESPAP